LGFLTFLGGSIMFWGFASLDTAFKGAHVVRDTSNVPINADSTPTYRIYGRDGLMTNGTGSLSLMDTGVITDATDASPIVITDTDHKLSTGNRITVANVGGQVGANGTHVITVETSNTFSLDGSTSGGTYTSGGTWNLTGLYAFSYTPTEANGFEADEVYRVVITYVVDSVTYVSAYTFQVS
jgi:hypothetical protein